MARWLPCDLLADLVCAPRVGFRVTGRRPCALQLLGHVRDTGADPRTERQYKTAAAIGYHCDAADVVGLLALGTPKAVRARAVLPCGACATSCAPPHMGARAHTVVTCTRSRRSSVLLHYVLLSRLSLSLWSAVQGQAWSQGRPHARRAAPLTWCPL